MDILFDQAILDVAPEYKLLLIEADVENSPTPDELKREIDSECLRFAETYRLENIKNRIAIRATRDVYRRLGKDPNRYRPSAESLSRRAVNGKGLYCISTLVDLINLISLQTGYSIGGFDSDMIVGESLELGVGRAAEPFEGIGRGALNIEGLPVFRDSVGGIGTPTSDNERTRLRDTTHHILITVNM